GEGGVAVVRATPAVEALSVPDGLPGAEPVPPLGQGRLLVQVAVQEDRRPIVAGPRGWDVDEDHRGPPGDLLHLDGRPLDRPGPQPPGHELDGPGHVA